jgi:putative hemolysin
LHPLPIPDTLFMINVEAAVTAKFPAFASSPALLRRPALQLLRKMLHEGEINCFLQQNRDVCGLDWIDRVFEFFDFSYSASARDRANIPATGRVVIIANHPIGSLDGLALLKLVGEVRKDVAIVANDLLAGFSELSALLIPVDNMTGGSALRSYRKVISALEQEKAVIVFPAGEVSRASPLGIRDGQWRPGFLHFARKARAPVLPIQVVGRNSTLFYGASLLYKPFSALLLSDEMFRQQSRIIRLHVGESIPIDRLRSDTLHDRTLVRRLRKHVYRLHRRGKSVFVTERTIAHPENRQHLQRELATAMLLGTTHDNNAIYLFDWQPDSAVMREIGRLRELAFRKAGEGTGKRRDLDEYDSYYRHLVLWDRDNLEIAGAYRIGEGQRILDTRGLDGFYTSALFEYHSDIIPFLQQGLELGRSFVNPQNWGKASLDYLWQGIGAYVAHHPDIRYLIGPVSMSAAYPRLLMAELVWYFSQYHAPQSCLAEARRPFRADPVAGATFAAKYAGLKQDDALRLLTESFREQQCRIPVLYKQYTALFEPGGFQTLVFSTDPDFADCLDGLCMADLSLLKATKRKRYVAERPGSHATVCVPFR